MFCISINHGGVVWAFLYKTEEAARAAHEKLLALPYVMPSVPESFTMEHARIMHEKPAPVIAPLMTTISDDYGQVGTFNSANIFGVLFEDMDQAKLAHVERTIHATKVQMEAQKRMHSDPGMRPAVLSPIPGNNFIRQ